MKLGSRFSGELDYLVDELKHMEAGPIATSSSEEQLTAISCQVHMHARQLRMYCPTEHTPPRFSGAIIYLEKFRCSAP